MPTKKQIKEQVEKLLDLHNIPKLNVIVQVAPDRHQRRALRTAASQAISRRRLSRSPRELLPQERGKKPTSKNRNASAYAWLGKKDVQHATEQVFKLAGLDDQSRLKELIANDVVQRVLAAMAEPGKKSGKRIPEPKPLYAAKAMPLQIERDMVMDLMMSMDGIQGIHMNRKLQLPTVMEVKPLAEESVDTLGSTWGILKSNALAAWGLYGARGQGVKVGILDTGIDKTHPDLKGKVAAFAEFDSLGKQISTTARDSDEHGTHCAGTIAGGNTSGRSIGMAPEAKLAAALVLDGDKGGTDAQVLAGIDWALQQGVDVISMSLGDFMMDAETPPTYTEAILTCIEQGVPVVAAIGNEGHQTTGSPGNDLFALSIGATDGRDRAAGFSGGRTQIIRESDYIAKKFLPLPYTKPDLSAPGVAVLSSTPGGKWKALSGTSMATPHVAGAIAQLLSATKIRDVAAGEERALLIQDLITGSVEDLGESGQDQRFGFGRLDVLRAIDVATKRGYS